MSIPWVLEENLGFIHSRVFTKAGTDNGQTEIFQKIPFSQYFLPLEASEEMMMIKMMMALLLVVE